MIAREDSVIGRCDDDDVIDALVVICLARDTYEAHFRSTDDLDRRSPGAWRLDRYHNGRRLSLMG